MHIYQKSELPELFVDMDKSDLIAHLAKLNPQRKIKDAESSVKVILDALCGSLVKGGRIEIRGFGSFSLSQTQPLQKRHPKSGRLIKVPMKYLPQFKPAKELRERVGTKTEAHAVAIQTPFPTPHNQLAPVARRIPESMTGTV